MERNYKYKAFISYSHSDRQWAKQIHRALETYRVPKYLVGQQTIAGEIPARLTPIFRDRDDLPSAPDLSERIKDALEASQNLIVICSPSGAKSAYVDEEIKSFKALGRSDRILSIIVDGDPAAIDNDDDCFAPALRARYDAEGRLLPGRTEPIAADVRTEGDGKSLARLKVVAGLLGLGLDDLRQREVQRKQRRMAIITSASLAAMAVTGILAITAFIARDEADQRRQQAEDLLGFMVGDLRDSLTPMGRLDLLEGVGEKAMEYFATVNVRHLTDAELLRHAEVLTQLGEIRVSQLQYDNALASLTEAYERSVVHYNNDPGDGERLYNRGQAEFWVGYVHWRLGALDEGRDWLTRYLHSSEELAALDTSRDDWAIEVAYGHHNLAVLAVDKDNLDAAEAGFRSELQTWQSLQDTNPDLDLRTDIADTLSWLGDVATSKGELGVARDYFERTAEIYRSLGKAEPDDRVLQYSWAHATFLSGEIVANTGDLDKAGELVDSAMSMLAELTAHDESNTEWRRSLAKTWATKGYLLAARDQWIEARNYAGRSVSALEAMIADGTADIVIDEQLADAYALTAWVLQEISTAESALEAIDAALENMSAVQATGRMNEERLGRLASILLERGQLLRRTRDDHAAQQSWQRAYELLKPKAPMARAPRLRDPWARILTLTGRPAEATTVRAALDASGYIPLRPWPDAASMDGSRSTD